MNPRTVDSLRLFCLTVVICSLPMAAIADPPTAPGDLKSLSGSFVVFDPAAGGSACWTPSTTQTLCFTAESFTDDWEWVYNLWLLLPSDWTVSNVAVAGSPSCDNGSFGGFAWSFQTPSYEIDIDQTWAMEPIDHCTASYCVDVLTGAGSGDVLVSWFWDGDEYGSAPHWPCSDDGYTPSGQSACDESTLPRALIPDCSSFGSLEGQIRDAYTSGPTCTGASATIVPGDITAPADAAGDYGPVFLADGTYDVTASASGFGDESATGVTVIAGTTTTMDFDLLRPVLGAAPTSFDTTVPTSSSADETLTLSNQGYLPPLDWTLSELPPTEAANPLSAPPAAGPVTIEPKLEAEMRSAGEAGYLIDFRERPDLSPALTMGWDERGRFVVNALMATAKRTQSRVRDYLDGRKVSYEAFWIDNIIAVPSSSREDMEGLLAFEEIEVLRAERLIGLIEPDKRSPALAEGRAIEANITHVLADQVWALGIDGTGMVVANLDTGVRYTHEVLEPHYRGNLGGGAFNHDYNWLDGVDGSSAAPFDDHGHGSHTMGTMIGDDGGANQVGMAPGATWIACDACEASGGCPTAALLTCAQWIAAPYPVGDPSSPDPTKRPHVVNNSWGDCDRSYDNWYQGSVDSWHAAGIYPIFSNGNNSNCGYPAPPGCDTVGNPGRYGNVTGVGSTGQSNGAYATHSNWGPTDNLDTVNPNGYPTLKPQVTAPGVSIRSSLNGSNSDYGSWNGTSMSAPHVSGLVALMWQAAPCLAGNYAQTEDIIQNSAVAIPYASNCGGEGPGNVPNMATGWGEIDALEAVIQAAAFCNTDWLPWVSEAPVSGQIASGGTEDVTLTFTCGASPGDETGALRLTTNDPCAVTVDIPLTLHCEDLITTADLALSKDDGVTTAVPGTGHAYTIVVSNAGPDDVVGATVSDTFPAVLTGVTWTCLSAGGASCTAAGSGDIADTVNLPVGGSATYTANATIDPAATGTLSNTATVAPPAGVTDPNPGNNGMADGTTLTPEVDLAVTKTDGVTTAVPGTGAVYTISVTNSGPSDAPGATVADTFPADLTGVSWTCLAAGGASCTAAGSGDIADIVNLPVGGSATYTVTATIDAGATGTLSNTATVTAPSGATDPIPGNNNATDTTALTPEVDLSTTKTDGLSTAMSGDPVVYTITAVNPGPSNAPGALVTDTFPAEVIGVTWTCAASGGASCTPTGAGDISDTVSLPVGGSLVYTATGSFANWAAGTITNISTVTAPPGVTELDFSNNLATDTTDVVAVAEVYGNLTDFRCWVPPGDPTTYTLEVFNDGPADAMGSLVDTYATVNLTGVTWTCTPTGGASCPASGTGDIFTAVDLPAGSSMVFSMTGTVDPGATGWLITTGYVATDPSVIDPTPDNAVWTDIDALEPPIFCDGFEMGTTGGWSETTP